MIQMLITGGYLDTWPYILSLKNNSILHVARIVQRTEAKRWIKPNSRVCVLRSVTSHVIILYSTYLTCRWAGAFIFTPDLVTVLALSLPLLRSPTRSLRSIEKAESLQPGKTWVLADKYNM